MCILIFLTNLKKIITLYITFVYTSVCLSMQNITIGQLSISLGLKKGMCVCMSLACIFFFFRKFFFVPFVIFYLTSVNIYQSLQNFNLPLKSIITHYLFLEKRRIVYNFSYGNIRNMLYNYIFYYVID